MAEETKPCVACAEEIKAKAVLCKHCKTRQDDEAFTSPIEVQSQDTRKENPIPHLVTIAGAASAVVPLILWGVLAFAFPSSTEEAQEETQSTQTALSSEPAPIPAGKLTQIGMLEIGDCLNDSDVDRSDPTDSVFAVSCDEVHDSEVIAQEQVVIGSRWEVTEVREEARRYCADSFVERFAGQTAPSQFTWRAHFSTEEQFIENGFVNFVCVLSHSGGKTVGQVTEYAGSELSDSSNARGAKPDLSTKSEVDEVEQQRQELQRQLDQQNAQLEGQRHADAIADYESKLNLYASEIATRQIQIEQLYYERDVAYAQFEATYGIPFVRGDNSRCGYTSDMFGCINAHASMPLYEFSIDQLASDIDFYFGLADSLVSPY